LYSMIGGVGVVIFWRVVWHTADLFSYLLFNEGMIPAIMIFDGPISLFLGTLILLLTGVFVSAFIGNRLIISGLSGDKKLAEKTEEEIRLEENQIKSMKDTLEKVEEEIQKIESKL
ncbi:MAG TPA: hypothetical protein VGC58_00990, partial [Candidatus Paceibacterota bacterium]